jgi:hypothetical protein
MNKSMPHHHHYTHIQPTSQLNFNFAKREQQLIYINLKYTIVQCLLLSLVAAPDVDSSSVGQKKSFIAI